MLVLDCTTSLGNDFANMKTAAKQFVETLITSNGGGATTPTITTSSVSNITQTTAQCGGNVTNNGGALVTSRGICWSTHENPTTEDSYVSSGSGTGSFTDNMSNLTKSTTYYVRAYAKNSAGIAYGSQKNFTTEHNIEACLYYGDLNNHVNCWGLTNGGTDQWAVMFPASTISQYSGTSITKIEAYLGMTGNYMLKIYKGGTTSPTTLIRGISFTVNTVGWNTITLSSPLALPVNTTLWVSISCTYNAGEYPAGACAGVGNKNARWKYLSSVGWYDVYDNNKSINVSNDAFVTKYK